MMMARRFICPPQIRSWMRPAWRPQGVVQNFSSEIGFLLTNTATFGTNIRPMRDATRNHSHIRKASNSRNKIPVLDERLRNGLGGEPSEFSPLTSVGERERRYAVHAPAP